MFLKYIYIFFRQCGYLLVIQFGLHIIVLMIICLQGMFLSLVSIVDILTCLFWSRWHSASFLECYGGFLSCRKEYLKAFLGNGVGDRAVDAATWNLHLLLKLILNKNVLAWIKTPMFVWSGMHVLFPYFPIFLTMLV